MDWESRESVEYFLAGTFASVALALRWASSSVQPYRDSDGESDRNTGA